MRLQYILACSIVAGVLFLSVDISSGKVLDTSEFDFILWHQKKCIFVFFYSAKNCDNCLPLLLTWRKLEELIASYPHSRLAIGQVNCDRSPDLCDREEIYTSGGAKEKDGDEEDAKPKHSMSRPVLKLFLKRDKKLMQLYLKHLLQQHTSPDSSDDEEETDQTEITYQEETIDLLNLELFLRRHLPKHVIEGSPTEDEDDGFDSFLKTFHRPNKGPIVFDVPKSFSDNTDLTDDDFAHFHAQGHHLVYFYTPTCELCQFLEEIFEMVLDKLASVHSVRLSRINCASQKVACKHYEVEDYPSLLWVTDGQLRRRVKNPAHFSSAHSLLTLIDSLLEEFGLKPEKSEGDSDDDEEEEDWKKLEAIRAMYWRHADSDVPKVLELNSENFYSAMKGGEGEKGGVGRSPDLFFVHFTVPWSRHCKRMHFHWDHLHLKIAQSKTLYLMVRIARVDCSVNERLCNDEQVDGYPTIVLYQKGKRVDEYEGSGRTAADFLEYLEPYVLQLLEDSTSSPSDPSSTEGDGGSGGGHRQTDEL